MSSAGEREAADWRAVNRRELRRARRELLWQRIVLSIVAVELLERVLYPPMAVLTVNQCMCTIGLVSGFALHCRRAIRKYEALERPTIVPAEVARSVDDVRRLAGAIRDTRDPVLYLRPFRADSTRRALDLVRAKDGDWRGRAVPVTHEEQIFLAFSLVGPVIGPGDPNDHSYYFGAHRIHVAGSVWQEAVADLMKSAQLVVLAPAPGSNEDAGLRWEIVCSRQIVDPGRLVVVLMEDGGYENFRLHAATVFPTLPETAPAAPAIISFDQQWLPTVRACPPRITKGPVENGFVRALTPTFVRTGSPWRRRRWKRRRDALLGRSDLAWKHPPSRG
ncbi:hypothetical protein [Frankia sp. AgB32]|uniref:hypothetical protein n=1 Tax=Frankia sp. AgB32 TaxID=631119 RepID=UPI00200EEF46|nr:hypothetical protein [Frankia sp. AgB32]MCK9897839.1 hypothetical protein [Frankia sp. AgB32]